MKHRRWHSHERHSKQRRYTTSSRQATSKYYIATETAVKQIIQRKASDTNTKQHARAAYLHLANQLQPLFLLPRTIAGGGVCFLIDGDEEIVAAAITTAARPNHNYRGVR